MAITATLLTSGEAGWDTASDLNFVTASITPGANCALFLLIAGVPDTSNSESLLWTGWTCVSSGSGPTWTNRVNSGSTTGFQATSCIHSATIGGTDPGSFTVTMDWGTSPTALVGTYAYALYKVTGHDTGTPYAGAVATRGQAGNGAVTATLAATPASGDVTLAINLADNDGEAGGGATFGSSFGTWTENAEGAGATYAVWNCGQRTGSTSTSVEWSDVNAATADNYSSAQAAIIVKVAGIGADKFLPSLLGDGVNTSTSLRSTKTCTASSTPHTIGTLVEVDASLSADADGIIVYIYAPGTNTAVTDTSTILEIYTGPATETLWARTLVGYRNGDSNLVANGAPVIIPGFIAAGTRVTCAARSAVGSKQVVAIYEFIAATRSVDYGAPVSMGIDTATSRGTALTVPGSLNVKGDWTLITASTSQAFTALAVSMQMNGTTVANGSGMSVDIGIGAEGAETVLIGDIVTSVSSSEYLSPRHPICFGVDIPSGSRLTARYSRADNSNAIDLALVGA